VSFAYKTVVFSIVKPLSFLIIYGISANKARAFQLEQFPLLSQYEESECLIIDDSRIAIEPIAVREGVTIFSKLTLFKAGGKIFVNPEVNKNQNALTISLETANRANAVSGFYCYVRVDIEIRIKDVYKKIYVVLDKTVLYELDIVDEQ